ADGWLAFALAFAALSICGPQRLLRRPAAIWMAAIGLNAAATAIWFLLGGFMAATEGSQVSVINGIWFGLLQMMVAAACAAVAAPFMLRAQESLMDRLGVPEVREA
ncbi:MAG: hypothetical protein ACKOIB_05130, partial [Verrucomicrobiota bacterium]